MQFQVLGCGTSTGVPVLGCGCAVCTSPNPKNRRFRTAGRIITDSGKTIIIDTGIDFRMQCLQNKIDSVDAVLFTHHHSDHILGVDDLRGFNFLRPTAIPCFAGEETLTEIKRVFAYLFSRDPNYEGGTLTNLALTPIVPGIPFELFGETIIPFQLWHGKFPVTGYRVRDVVYATDCNVVPQEAKETMAGAQYLFLDALRYRAHKTHLTVEQAIVIAQELKAAQTYFIHMSHDVDYDAGNQMLPPGIEFAYDGLTVSVT